MKFWQNLALVNIASTVAKLGNICVKAKFASRNKNVFVPSENTFCFNFEKQHLFSQHIFPARLKWETFASATVFPSCQNLKPKPKLLLCPITADTDNPMNQSKPKQIHAAGAKRGKTRGSKSRLVLVLLLIGCKQACENGAKYFSQSQSVTFQNQSNPAKLLSTLK